MQENIKNATDLAFSDNVADMQGEVESALQYKIINALEQRRIEIAMGLMQNEDSECDDEDMEDSEDEDSSEEDDKEEKKKSKKSVKEAEELDEVSPEKLGAYIKSAKETLPDKFGRDPYGYMKRSKNINKAVDKLTKKVTKEEYIEEKLSVSDGVDAWIKDFVHSDDPRFEGKSKKDRIRQAVAAFNSAKRANSD